MTDKQWVGLGVRLSGILLGIYFMAFAIRTISFFKNPETAANVDVAAYVTLGTIILLIVFLMIAFPLTVAGKIVPGDIDDGSISNESKESVQGVILSVAGVIILAIRLPDLVYWIIYIMMINEQGSTDGSLGPDVIAPLITTFVEIAIALWLVFGARGIIGAIRTIRSAGIEK